MSRLALSAALALALATPGLAQTAPNPATPASPSAPATQSAPSTPSTSTTGRDTTGSTTRAAVNAAPLENGANSFTQDQATSRLRDAGINDVTGLAKDDNGIWRGRGTWQGRSVSVGIDFRGNISAQ